jgi:hypothetical protein
MQFCPTGTLLVVTILILLFSTMNLAQMLQLQIQYLEIYFYNQLSEQTPSVRLSQCRHWNVNQMLLAGDLGGGHTLKCRRCSDLC